MVRVTRRHSIPSGGIANSGAPSQPAQQQQQQQQKHQQALAQSSPAARTTAAKAAAAGSAVVGAEPNVQSVVLGDMLIRAWYPSFYPEELVDARTERLYTCPWCFRYSKELMPYLGHMNTCPVKQNGPPGEPIYQRGECSVYEVDGEQHKLFTQNISLFAKLFLDTKSVFYDVTTFLYYILTMTDPNTGELSTVGFFSKEKLSWDNNNLACIIVFPPWQRKGYGQILMGVSYELSKRERRLGGPEKPLSELGRKGYLAFWSSTIARCLLGRPAKKNVTVRKLSEETYIQPDDIVAALKEMGIVDRRKRGSAEALINKAKVRAWVEANRVSLQPLVYSESFLREEVTDEEMEDVDEGSAEGEEEEEDDE
ncbi:acyl-CoA N-acyltransferase [Lineolata rhizophorae]|uniref:histone acetyltransferase n=1 Tax=Lineolata rhizophorae TaxID=578093 RepID=A0A6A6P111_9PEZI|nr:acyl-CoA N-acyltransferase [Lineolata rhizophorae]